MKTKTKFRHVLILLNQAMKFWCQQVQPKQGKTTERSKVCVEQEQKNAPQESHHLCADNESIN